MLIITGVPVDDKEIQKSYAISLGSQSNQESCTFHFPSLNGGIYGAAGGVVNSDSQDRALICGGFNDEWKPVADCHLVSQNEMKPTTSLQTKRGKTSAIVIGSDTLFVTGGSKEKKSEDLYTTELIRVDSPPTPGPNLLYGVRNHCFLKINESMAMVVGGTNDHGALDTTMLINIDDIENNQFKSGAVMNKERYAPACGLTMSSEDVGDNVPYVVVISGSSEDKSVEVWSTLYEQWTLLHGSQDFYYGVTGAETVTAKDGKSFFLLGGTNFHSEKYYDTIYQVTYDGKYKAINFVKIWETFSPARAYFLALPIPDSMLPQEDEDE